MDLLTRKPTIEAGINVPGAPMVRLKTDPAKEPGIVERVTSAGVTVFWTRSQRRWIYDPTWLRPL